MPIFPFHRFVTNAPFLYPLKTSENLTHFWCFWVVEKGHFGNKWVPIPRAKFRNPELLNQIVEVTLSSGTNGSGFTLSFSLILLHTTPAISFAFSQLWLPMPLCQQYVISSSLPQHCTSSSQYEELWTTGKCDLRSKGDWQW